MKMKAGTCCTWASPAAGATGATARPERPIRLNCGPGRNCATTIPPAEAVQPINDANDNRMVDTASITCNQEFLLGTELLYIRGPFSLQAEYGWNFLNNAQVTIPTAKPISNYVFNGGYVQVAYTLTGENRAYDREIRRSVPVLLRQPGTVRERFPRP